MHVEFKVAITALVIVGVCCFCITAYFDLEGEKKCPKRADMDRTGKVINDVGVAALAAIPLSLIVALWRLT